MPRQPLDISELTRGREQARSMEDPHLRELVLQSTDITEVTVRFEYALRAALTKLDSGMAEELLFVVNYVLASMQAHKATLSSRL